EITDRVSKSAGAANVALLFERVEGFTTPVLVNAFGSEERMAWALGVERLGELGERLGKLLDLRVPGTFAERRRKLGSPLERAGPGGAGEVGRAPAQARLADGRGALGAPQGGRRALPGSGRDRGSERGRPADPAMLARRRRALRHAARGLHPRWAHGGAERRHVPAPGVRRADPRHALADPQGRRRARARGRRAHGRGPRAGRRPRARRRGPPAQAAARGPPRGPR